MSCLLWRRPRSNSASYRAQRRRCIGNLTHRGSAKTRRRGLHERGVLARCWQPATHGIEMELAEYIPTITPPPIVLIYSHLSPPCLSGREKIEYSQVARVLEMSFASYKTILQFRIGSVLNFHESQTPQQHICPPAL